MAADNRYSRFVAWVRILLPLAALALLSSLFLVANRPELTPQLPFADISLDDLAREQRLKNPTFTGVTDTGRALTLTADRAWPHATEPDRMDVERLRAEIGTGEDGLIRLSSQTARVNTRQNVAVLTGDVLVTTSSGYEIRTQELTAALTQSQIDSAGEVQADGPPGRLVAGRMSIGPAEGASSDVVVVFKDGVKLIYTPQN